jgi:hypothetical protein
VHLSARFVKVDDPRMIGDLLEQLSERENPLLFFSDQWGTLEMLRHDEKLFPSLKWPMNREE